MIPIIGQNQGSPINVEFSSAPPELRIGQGIHWTRLPIDLASARQLKAGIEQVINNLEAQQLPLTGDKSREAIDVFRRPAS
jgi:hypothetical protein